MHVAHLLGDVNIHVYLLYKYNNGSACKPAQEEKL